MANTTSKFVCSKCGASFKKWVGHCSACDAWDTLKEDKSSSGFTKIELEKNSNTNTSKIEFASLEGEIETPARRSTNISELDRVLGGGIVPGSAVLVGGDPGIGKSTVLLQALSNMATKGLDCVYITGEESVDQVRMRAKRLGVGTSSVRLASATSVDDIIASLKLSKTAIVVIDSIQTMFLNSISSAPGTVSQVRSSAYELISYAKNSDAALLIVGHVTKDGQIAGPKVLEHMVDTVLYFEGDRGHQFRILRAVKNRFGAANEIGVFEMTEKGLMEVKNPSSLFISGKARDVSGSVIFAGIEGTRPVLVEIQALVSPSTMAMPRRAVVGWDANRLAMILAVLQTRCGVKLADKEVYLNVAGGLKISEPAADLAVASAILSSLANIPVAENSVIFGEVGLSGEVRPVCHANQRIREAEKLGFTKGLVPLNIKSESNDFILDEIKYISDLRRKF